MSLLPQVAPPHSHSRRHPPPPRTPDRISLSKEEKKNYIKKMTTINDNCNCTVLQTLNELPSCDVQEKGLNLQ